MHHPQDEAPERYLVRILLSSMEAHLPQGQEEEDEDESDWGLASVSCTLGTAKLIFTFWKVNNREGICKVKIKVTSSHFSAQKKKNRMFVSSAASRSCHTDFLHVDLSSLVNSRGCNKTRDTCELHLHFWFLFGLFQLYLCVFPRTKADLYSSYQMASCLSKTKEINPEKSAC